MKAMSFLISLPLSVSLVIEAGGDCSMNLKEFHDQVALGKNWIGNNNLWERLVSIRKSETRSMLHNQIKRELKKKYPDCRKEIDWVFDITKEQVDYQAETSDNIDQDNVSAMAGREDFVNKVFELAIKKIDKFKSKSVLDTFKEEVKKFCSDENYPDAVVQQPDIDTNICPQKLEDIQYQLNGKNKYEKRDGHLNKKVQEGTIDDFKQRFIELMQSSKSLKVAFLTKKSFFDLLPRMWQDILDQDTRMMGFVSNDKEHLYTIGKKQHFSRFGYGGLIDADQKVVIFVNDEDPETIMESNDDTMNELAETLIHEIHHIYCDSMDFVKESADTGSYIYGEDICKILDDPNDMFRVPDSLSVPIKLIARV